MRFPWERPRFMPLREPIGRSSSVGLVTPRPIERGLHRSPQGDIDIWVAADERNAGCVFRAIAQFGAPLGSLGVSAAEFAAPDRVIQIGLPPRRIDVLTGVSGIVFDKAWARRASFHVSDLSVPVLGRDDLILNKRAAGRPKDLADLAVLDRETK
jgi:hypothetical protein